MHPSICVPSEAAILNVGSHVVRIWPNHFTFTAEKKIILLPLNRAIEHNRLDK